jgi:hypothetical protein
MKQHHWSVWPGAWCFDCGWDDPLEYAIANDLLDPCENKWVDSDEARKVRELASRPCPGKYNPKCPQCKVHE